MAIQNDFMHTKAQQVENTAAVAIAKVVSVSGYEAETIQLAGSSEVQDVVAHLNNVPPLREDDQVLASKTQQGYVVTGRLRTDSESPLDGVSYEDGKLRLLAGHGIRIQSGDAIIELTANGKIKIDGKNIYSISEGRHRLQGSTIELN